MTEEEKKKETAYHESGHAVVGHLQSFHMKFITIIPERDNKGNVRRWGHTDWVEKHDPDEIRCSISEKIISKFYAGPIAEQLFTRDTTKQLFLDDHRIDFITERNDKDYDMASNYHPCPDPSGRLCESYFRIYTQTKIILQNHWRVIKALVSELLQQESMFGEEANLIIKNALNEYKK